MINNTLSYNELYLDDNQVTYPELEMRLDNIQDFEVIELVKVDSHGNLHFETNTYSIHY